MEVTTYTGAQLPWSATFQEDKWFKKILLGCFLMLFICGVVIPMLPVPKIERAKLESLPPQLAKVVMEKKKLPPPPKPKPKPKKEEKPKEKEKPKPKEKPKEKKKPEKKKEKPKKTVEQARKKAATSGVLAFADELADMRESLDLDTLKPTANLTASAGQAEKIERSIITGRATSTSGGITTSEFSRDAGGTALSTRETTRVKTVAVEKIKKQEKKKKAGLSGRTDESVRKVFDRNRGALFAIYNRALRKDPSLQGKVTLELVIEPDGAVSSCKVVSSELNSPALEAKLISRIKLINFGVEKVSRSKINYSIDFLPY